jgi:hypothetical protein
MQGYNADLARLAGLQGVVGPKRVFRDRAEVRAYERAILLTKRLLDDPTLVERARAYLNRFVSKDPNQKRAYDLWIVMLATPLERFVPQFLADNEDGAYLRETVPVFTIVPPSEVRELTDRATA